MIDRHVAGERRGVDADGNVPDLVDRAARQQPMDLVRRLGCEREQILRGAPRNQGGHVVGTGRELGRRVLRGGDINEGSLNASKRQPSPGPN